MQRWHQARKAPFQTWLNNISYWIQSVRASTDANLAFWVAGASRFTSTLVVAGMMW
jgi:hypothetical protein